MGLYKRCSHKQTKAENSCAHDWWGQFMHKGTNYRINLVEWSGEKMAGRREAEAVYERMRAAVRAGTFREGESGREHRPSAALPAADPAGVSGSSGSPAIGTDDSSTARESGSDRRPTSRITVAAFCKIYVKDKIEYDGMASAKDETSRVEMFRERFSDRVMDDVSTHEMRTLILTLRDPYVPKKRKQMIVRDEATVDRYIQRWRAMYAWGKLEGYLTRTPFYSETGKPLIQPTNAENKRPVRISEDILDQILVHAPEHVRDIAEAATDLAIRKNALRHVTYADIDDRPGWIRLRAEFAKGKKGKRETRWVPVTTTRVVALIEKYRYLATGDPKAPEMRWFSDSTGTAFGDFRKSWERARDLAGYKPDKKNGKLGIRFHDTRKECLSRLADSNVPPKHLKEIAGHASYKTTDQFYITAEQEKIRASAGVLENYLSSAPKPPSGKPFSTLAHGSPKKQARTLRLVGKAG